MNDWVRELESLASPEKARLLQRFFKTGPGQYGEGDVFLGIPVPLIRASAKKHKDITLDDCAEMLRDARHEVRLAALIWLVGAFRRGNQHAELAYNLYMSHRARINNWDLVDTTASPIAGAWLYARDRSVLHELTRSERLWDRRIAVVATHFFIKRGDFGDTLCMCSGLLADPEDLMHKACGWMLREVGKQDVDVLRDFLGAYAHRMPRTLLRYAIERLPEAERQAWLRGGRGCP